MELALFFKAVLSLAFVLGLLLLTLWAIKYLEVNAGKARFLKKLADERRIDVLEMKKIDAKNSLVLVRRDDTEHLLVLGPTNLVVESMIKSEPQIKTEGENK